MEKFNFSYDSENDDLFVYLDGKKSAGAVEVGDFILDFDEKGSLVAMEITNTSQVLNKILSQVIELNKIQEIKVEIINFRNMNAIKFLVKSENFQETANILIPHIKERSPVLSC